MIAHIDADSFFASVLVRQHPSLKGKPLLALGMGGGCVIAASYEAKAKGVKTGMPVTEALKLAPGAITMPSDLQEAGLASEQIEKILRDACYAIEQYSIDEWYLDLSTCVGGNPVDVHTWGVQMQQKVLDCTDLSVSIGIGPSKLLAKMAGEYKKPAGVTALSPVPSPAGGRGVAEGRGEGLTVLDIELFLRDRPAAAIPGIGRQRSVHTDAHHWKTAWDIATAPTEMLRTLFGKQGEEIQRELLGESLFAVNTGHVPPKSISRARSFRPEKKPRIVWAHVLRHCEYTVLKMRRHSLACRGISVWLRDSDYNYKSAHVSLPQPITTEEALQPYIRKCLLTLYKKNTAYTQIGLALWKLSDQGPAQYSLFETTDRICQGEDLQETLDKIHTRFGRNAITRGAALPVRTGTSRSLELSTYD
jgi:DNA polymerase-4/DNA polymerase V